MFTLANLLTLSRILLTPLTVLFLFLPNKIYTIFALLTFTLASITDYFDGYYARKYNMQTKLGAFLDPFADKILTLGTFFAFYYLGAIQLWMVLCIAARDLIVTLLRMIMANNGYTMVTTWSAKWKTVLQFFAIYSLFIFMLTNPTEKHINITIIMYGVVGFTLWTGLAYVIKNRRNLFVSFDTSPYAKTTLKLRRTRRTNGKIKNILLITTITTFSLILNTLLN